MLQNSYGYTFQVRLTGNVSGFFADKIRANWLTLHHHRRETWLFQPDAWPNIHAILDESADGFAWYSWKFLWLIVLLREGQYFLLSDCLSVLAKTLLYIAARKGLLILFFLCYLADLWRRNACSFGDNQRGKMMNWSDLRKHHAVSIKPVRQRNQR